MIIDVLLLFGFFLLGAVLGVIGIWLWIRQPRILHVILANHAINACPDCLDDPIVSTKDPS